MIASFVKRIQRVPQTVRTLPGAITGVAAIRATGITCDLTINKWGARLNPIANTQWPLQVGTISPVLLTILQIALPLMDEKDWQKRNY